MNFRAIQQLHLVRQIEQHNLAPWAEELSDCAASVEAELGESGHSFAGKAYQRAQQLCRVSGFDAVYQQFSQRNRLLGLGLYVAIGAIGFFAVLQTLISADRQINVYWLLLLLVGINSVSMLLWLLLSLRHSVSHSPVLLLYKKLIAWFSRRVNGGVFFTAWSETHFRGKPGRWFLSKHLQAAWLMYLCGSLVALVITLSGKQYDFVWGTTILPTQAFVSLTEILGAGPALLGFDVPDKQAIIASELGAQANSMTQHRRSWASFVFSCILLYAVLPRLLLWVWSALALRSARHHYQPDWEHPYFYALRNRLLPKSKVLGVIDPDERSDRAAVGTEAPPSPPVEPQLLLQDVQLPVGAYLGAFEWGDSAIPAVPIIDAINFGKINEVHAQTGALQAIKQSPRPTVILVELQRAADRGATRFLGQIDQLTNLHLVVVKRAQHETDVARWAGWQAAADRIKLHQSRLHLVRLR